MSDERKQWEPCEPPKAAAKTWRYKGTVDGYVYWLADGYQCRQSCESGKWEMCQATCDSENWPDNPPCKNVGMTESEDGVSFHYNPFTDECR